MGFNKVALEKIANTSGIRESFKLVLAELVSDHTINNDAAGLIGHALDAHPELDEAIKAEPVLHKGK